MPIFALLVKGLGLHHRPLLLITTGLSLLLLFLIPLTSQPATAGVNSWTPTFLPSSMNITAMTISPAFPCDKTVFMATDGYGVFRTVEGDSEQAIWYPSNSGLAHFGISSLAISPNYNRCDRASQFNQGDNTLFLGTKLGVLYKSTNGGATWLASSSGLPNTAQGGYNIAALGISPNYASDRTVFVSLQATVDGGPNAVYRSTDAGSTWLPFDAGLNDRTVQAFAISANYANDATLFVGTRFSGVYRFAGTLSAPSVPPGGSAIPGAPAPTATPIIGGRTSQATLPPPQLPRLQAISVPYPSIRLTETAFGTADGQTAYSVPGPVVLNYQVINNGNEVITNISVIDGGNHDFCGDDPDTADVNEGKDDQLVGNISSLNPGGETTITATFLLRPASAAAVGADVTFLPKRYAGCAIGTSATVGTVVAQDDAVVQLVIWTTIAKTNSELSNLWIWSFAVSPFFANDQTIFAGSAFGGLFKSSNAGTAAPTWRRVNTGLEPEWVSIRAIALSPHYPNDRLIFVGTEKGVFRGVENADGSVTWSSMSKGLASKDIRALGISPNFLQDQALFAAAWGNDPYRLRNAGSDPTWMPQRRVLNGLWAWTTALTADAVLLAGTWSGGPFWPGIIGRNVLPGTTGWEFPALPVAPGGETLIVTVSPTYCNGYAIFAGTWDRGMLKSTDGGRTWATVPIPTSLPIRDISLSPRYAQDNTLYVATWGTGIYRSFDAGATWGQLNAGLPDTFVRSVLLPPSYGQDGIVFAGTDTAGVMKWDPAKNLWATANVGLPNMRVMALAASPQYAVDGTLAAATWGGGVAISSNRGQTWSASTNGLSANYIRSVALSPNFNTDRAIYTGTISGAYRSPDGGGNWSLLGNAGEELASIDVTGLAITPGSPRTIFASTGGRGIWQYTESTTVSQYTPLAQLAAHINPSLPNHVFLPIAPKNRVGKVC